MRPRSLRGETPEPLFIAMFLAARSFGIATSLSRKHTDYTIFRRTFTRGTRVETYLAQAAAQPSEPANPGRVFDILYTQSYRSEQPKLQTILFFYHKLHRAEKP